MATSPEAVWLYSGPRRRCRASFPTRRSSDLERDPSLIRTGHEHAHSRPHDSAEMFDQDLAAVVRPGMRVLVTGDRKSTRLNSSHSQISYAVFCLKQTNHAEGDELAPGL